MKKRIMVVDDNKAMVEMLKEFFSSNSNIEVVDTAYDGEEAWEKIKENSNRSGILHPDRDRSNQRFQRQTDDLQLLPWQTGDCELVP